MVLFFVILLEKSKMNENNEMNVKIKLLK